VRNRIEIAMLFVVGLALAAIFGAYWLTTEQLHQVYEVDAEPIVLPAGSAAITEGERLTKVRGCFWCHGPSLQGKLYFADAWKGVIVAAPNLTQKIHEYSPAEFARAVRHGVRRDGTSVQPAMPAFAFYSMSDEDMGAIISYIASLPASDGIEHSFQLLPVGWFRWIAGRLPPNTAELIDHEAGRPDPTVDGDPAARGRYLAESICTECHGDNGRIRVPLRQTIHAKTFFICCALVRLWATARLITTWLKSQNIDMCICMMMK
jgi:mono/diheme cytochrome c family protein